MQLCLFNQEELNKLNDYNYYVKKVGFFINDELQKIVKGFSRKLIKRKYDRQLNLFEV